MPNLEPNSASAAFRTGLVKENAWRLRVVAQVLIGVVILFGILNIIAILLGTLGSTSLGLGILYPMFFFLNVGAFFTLRTVKNLENFDADQVQYYDRVVSIYVFLVMTIAALISLFDQQEYQHLMVFTMIILICSSFLVLPRRKILLPLIVSSGIVAIGLPFFVEDSERLPGLYQHLLSYTPIAYAISRVLYKMFVDNHQDKVRLEQEIEKNELLNHRLIKANERLETLALSDELTGIANLRGLETFLKEEFKDVFKENNDISLAAIVMDIDYFKEYNDYHGHGQGDQVLSRIGHALSRVAEKTSGFISRWGGEEFIYVGFGKNRDGIVEVCESIHRAIKNLKIPHERSAVAPYVTVSQGACSAVVRSMEDVRACIQQADLAMYTTKKKGRDGYTYFPYPESIGRAVAAHY